MKMKLLPLALIVALSGCDKKNETSEVPVKSSISGTWKLVSSKIITKGDTAITFPVKNQEMIKTSMTILLLFSNMIQMVQKEIQRYLKQAAEPMS